LSSLARGTVQEKLRWIFALYDLDGDGVLTREELYRIICAVYDLLGRVDPSSDELAAMDHADKIFKVRIS
jgi:Ca2+-binding EF-hand superfamily protein